MSDRLSFLSCATLFLTVVGTIIAASIPIFLRFVLLRTIALVFLLVTRQKLAILRHRSVLDHGKDRRSWATLGTVDVSRSARLIYRVYWRLPTDRQIHPSLRLLAAERGFKAILYSRCEICSILNPLRVPFVAGQTSATSFPEDGIVHSIWEWLVLQILRVQSFRQNEFVDAGGNLWSKKILLC